MRNPIKDQVAIVGVGTTDYVRTGGTKSQGQLAVDACMTAVRDAGLSAKDIDGLAGATHEASPQYVQEGLGIPEATWWTTTPVPFSLLLTDAINAVYAGACTTALVYQSKLRTVATSSSASAFDPLRSAPDPQNLADPHFHKQFTRPYGGPQLAYAGYMRRYMYEYGVDRQPFALVAVNNRTNASENPHAALRKRITTDEYMAARMVRDPMCVFDMDYIVDGADAVVVTTAERAIDLHRNPVYVHAVAYGGYQHAENDSYTDLETVGQAIAARTMWSKSDFGPNDVDVLFPYDGFSIIVLRWLENFGYCSIGEAGSLLQDAWIESEQRVRLGGKIPLNPHGGSLSEGATQGAGHVREAVTQLQGRAGARQLPVANVALLGIGGLFNNSSALILRT